MIRPIQFFCSNVILKNPKIIMMLNILIGSVYYYTKVLFQEFIVQYLHADRT